eukprot:SAG25_NODE_5556_length_645_cov_0.738095_1_plen_117_part_10
MQAAYLSTISIAMVHTSFVHDTVYMDSYKSVAVTAFGHRGGGTDDPDGAAIGDSGTTSLSNIFCDGCTGANFGATAACLAPAAPSAAACFCDDCTGGPPSSSPIVVTGLDGTVDSCL